ncbi:helix-turn-helix domain-containing protein [Phragmitibacter flavus]|uniref:Helix-turn-helix domain-containing protein n=1 Tax=Phragmitibacter flavus TaxID=2576071 RepID=A0A5R8KL70_9BACT|nr:AraC family transcriptional regulator [Phragmitibacter flavus]TLD72419.1 helix-turn-helix domain-containing protein [Phragmitibacter flavus]
MKNYRPLLIQDLQLSLPNLQVLRLRMNRHVPEARWTSHAHEHDQILVYLMGKGQQRVDGALYPARPGTVIHVAKGVEHAFEQSRGRPPLCLVMDVVMEGGRGTSHVCDQLTAEQLAETKARMSTLFRHPQIEKREMSLRVGAVVLDVLDMALKSIGWLTAVNRFGAAKHFSLSKRVERLLETKDGPEVDLKEIAEMTGYQQDHLNRLLRTECGLTLGQLRSRVRLKRAVAMLEDKRPVQEVGAKVGILDANYFARWFKQQTGVSPSVWRRRPGGLRF